MLKVVSPTPITPHCARQPESKSCRFIASPRFKHKNYVQEIFIKSTSDGNFEDEDVDQDLTV
ncbi:hypothetical protein L9F63_012169, partial [Diploptera punctata]